MRFFPLLVAIIILLTACAAPAVEPNAGLQLPTQAAALPSLTSTAPATDTAVAPTITAAPATATPMASPTATALPTETASPLPSPTATIEPSAEPASATQGGGTTDGTEVVPTALPIDSAELTVTPLEATRLPPISGGDKIEPTPMPNTYVPPSLSDFIETIKSDLVAQKGIAREAIWVMSFEEVIWPDGSLGCPEPGMMYTMATVNGFRIVFGAAEQTYAYHTDGTRSFKLCENKPFGGLQNGGGTGIGGSGSAGNGDQ